MLEDIFWADDLLGRKDDARAIIDYLVSRHKERKDEEVRGSYVLNLNAGWGHGKTFFLERLAGQLKCEGYLAAYVNGWRDDAAKDPMIATIASIENTLSPYLLKEQAARDAWRAAKAASGKIAAAAAKGVVKKIARKFIGEGVEEIVEIFQEFDELNAIGYQKIFGKDNLVGEGAIDEISSNISESLSSLSEKAISDKVEQHLKRIGAVEQFRINVESVLSKVSHTHSKHLPLFVLVDELDRCRPTYAIETLEQIKHLFNIDDIVFVIATDSSQLSHSVKAVYGAEFEAERYLNRFFNRQYHFDEPNRHAFVSYLFDRHPSLQGKLSAPVGFDIKAFFSIGMDAFNVPLRDIEQCFDILRSVATVWEANVEIELILIIPLIVWFQKPKKELFESFAGGGDFNLNLMPTWKIKVRDPRSDDGISDLSVSALCLNLRARLSKPLYQVVRADSDSSVGGNWTTQRLSNEITRIHNGRYVPGSPMPSIMLSYAARVRGAGKFNRVYQAT